MAVQPIPAGYHSITPYLIIDGCARALDYYQKVFGAREVMRHEKPDGGIMHAEIQVGTSLVMLADEYPEMNYRGPKSLGGSPISLLLYVENADEVFQRAVDGGATVLQPIKDQFYGDRSGTLVDPFGHVWTIATHVEDVTPEEMERRMEEWKKQN